MEDVKTEKSQERLAVLEKIREYDRLGLFDKDVEDDPVGKILMPDEINYIKKDPISAIKRKIAFLSAYLFWHKATKKKAIILLLIKY